MLGTILSVAGAILGFVGQTSKSVIDASVITTVAGLKYSSSVITSAMSHKTYWLVWGIAAGSMAIWFAWGMLDTTLNGALPDVAVIPPGLEPYAKVVWENIFWTGLGGYTVSRGAGVLERIFG